jgi:hypothetical protein
METYFDVQGFERCDGCSMLIYDCLCICVDCEDTILECACEPPF